MPTRITQIENTRGYAQAIQGENGGSRLSDDETAIVLKVEGTLYLRDTELLEKICRNIAARANCTITLDLANINFLDSDGAAVLCRMKREQGVRLEGLHLFIAKVVELSEAEEVVCRYLPRANERGG
jgi:anti-anti-sigma factor